MSVVVILLWLWWGLLGFIATAVGVWALISVLGPTGRLVVILLVGVGGGHLLDRYLYAEERAANGFLDAWAAESADFPKGRAYTREIGEYLDYDRLGGTYNPYLAQWWRLRWHSQVRSAGREDVQTTGTDLLLPTKVFLADAHLHGSEHDVDFRTTIRIWIATDTHRVAKYMFEGVRFD